MLHREGARGTDARRAYRRRPTSSLTSNMGLARTMYIRCIYGILCKDFDKICGCVWLTYTRFWPTILTHHAPHACNCNIYKEYNSLSLHLEYSFYNALLHWYRSSPTSVKIQKLSFGCTTRLGRANHAESGITVAPSPPPLPPPNPPSTGAA
jgi:hypothetical protein